MCYYAPSYMICNIDYNEVLEYHKKNGKDVTMVYKKVKNADDSICRLWSIKYR